MRYAIFMASLWALVVSAFAYPNNPPMGYAGNPPDYNSCVNCHDSFPLNSGDGNLQISGLPVSGYNSGVTYPLTVVLDDPGQDRWGFELTALVERSGNYYQGGDLIVTDASHTSLGAGSGTLPDYLRQTSAGTFNGTIGPVAWHFNWIAPDTSAGTVTFYAAGLACNGTGGTGGDYDYNISAPLSPESPSAVWNNAQPLPGDFKLLPAFPNPFNPTTIISFELPVSSLVKLEVFDINGRNVGVALAPTRYEPGAHHITIAGSHLSSGIYLAKLTAGDFTQTQKLVLLK